ncbi:MAG: hypothetical protein JWN66_210 [Sphingomonas bacterium]|uniref:hypothetical protein n=1 Tax=Sphingomonas bacterium TaxID=1895847 RepID=UPI002634964D|nr:hypothetical protein [Sphingomonas bacterium]MDB5703094.1 hypothetical protein [Sphingomonas bacterium]
MSPKLIGAATLLCLATGAPARDWPIVENWQVEETGIGECAMTTRFGDTVIRIDENDSGIGYFAAVKPWSKADAGKTYPITYSFDDWKTVHNGEANGFDARGAIGLRMETDAGFSEELADISVKTLRVAVHAVDFGGVFDMTGAKKAMTTLQECTNRR